MTPEEIQDAVDSLVKEVDVIRAQKLKPAEMDKKIKAVEEKILEVRGGMRGHHQGIGTFTNLIKR